MTDDEFAIDILPRVSRTFALSIEALPEPLRSTIRVSYLLCRIVDTIEDEPEIPEDRRQQLFDHFAHVVGDDSTDVDALEAEFANWEGNDDRRLCRHLGSPMRLFRSLDRPLANAARPHIVEMARGMAEYALRWQGSSALTVLRDVEDLERYCYYVAGTVGNLLTDVFIIVHPDLDPEVKAGLEERSVSFGLGLQMTNIVKDVATDRGRGWCFLPKSICDQRGIRPKDLGEPNHREEAMAVVRDVVDLARGHLDQALEYTLLLPPDAPAVRLFVLVPLVLALSTVSLVHRSPEVLDPSAAVKVSRETVTSALIRARDVLADDEGIRHLCTDAAALAV